MGLLDWLNSDFENNDELTVDDIAEADALFSDDDEYFDDDI